MEIEITIDELSLPAGVERETFVHEVEQELGRLFAGTPVSGHTSKDTPGAHSGKIARAIYDRLGEVR